MWIFLCDADEIIDDNIVLVDAGNGIKDVFQNDEIFLFNIEHLDLGGPCAFLEFVAVGAVDEGEVQTLRNFKILAKSFKSYIFLRFLQLFTLFFAVVFKDESQNLSKSDVFANDMKNDRISVKYF